MVITDTVSRLGLGQTRVTLEPRGEIDAGSVDDLVRALEATMDALASGVPLGLASRELVSTWSNHTALAGVLDALSEVGRS